MRHAMILRVVSKLFIPLILLFGLYVQFHGDFGPGGGFQAGVIFAAAFILYALIYGVEEARRVAPAGPRPSLFRLGGSCSTSARAWPACWPGAISSNTRC